MSWFRGKIIRNSEFIDLRFFKSMVAMGIINAMVGYYYLDRNIRYIVNNEELKDYLLSMGIDPDSIVLLTKMTDYRIIIGSTIISPFQRIKIDVLLLRILGLIKFKCFVHDLHFLSKKKVISVEFKKPDIYFKSFIYKSVIRFADHIYVDSIFVKRQLSLFFNKKSEVKVLKRVFSFTKNQIDSISKLNKSYDYFLSLSNRSYKGLWGLSKLKFEDKNATVLIDKRFFDQAKSLLSKNNPNLVLKKTDTKTDFGLSKAYKSSKATISLSLYEGFGYIPYEACFFKSVPIVLNRTAYNEVPTNTFFKIDGIKSMVIKSISSLNFNHNMSLIAKKHIVKRIID